ncbi:hypothetical protein TNCV_4955531 [Trichonephila clavipes]|nr:hypothetical protein TNCV_4955531 [Trichonephila clavipes]
MHAKIPRLILRESFFDHQTWRRRHNVWGCIGSLLAAANCEAMAVLTSPKPIPKVNLVPRPKHNKAFVGFTRMNNQGECNNIQGNAEICQSVRMEQNIHR